MLTAPENLSRKQRLVNHAYNSPVPVVPVAVAVLAAVNSGLACALAFGVELSAEQSAAIQSTVNAFLVLAVSMSHAVAVMLGARAINGNGHAE